MTKTRLFRVALFCLFILTLSTPFTRFDLARAQAATRDPATREPATREPVTRAAAIKETRKIVDEIIQAAYPELAKVDIQIKAFNDDADYFRTLLSFKRFLFGQRMQYFIRVNPRLFELAAPEEGVRAILAHELGHVFEFHQQNRMKLLRLVRLMSKTYTARFERRTDLQAISRGYGAGLKAYRVWLYQHVPAKKLAEKQRNYFSPEEIEAIEMQLKANPSRLAYWFKHVPLKLEDIIKQ